MRETLSDLLQMKGYAVECAEDGEQALNIMTMNGTPDLVITDLRPTTGGSSTQDA